MKFNLILILLLNFFYSIENSELIKIRNLYEQAALKEDVHLKLANLLLNSKVESTLISSYKGANIMIGANYVFNPISKLSKFNKGKKFIEHAVENEPNNVEIRYIRFTIQTNLPKFLGYSSYINRDKEFIINQLGLISDGDLRSRIVAYLLSSNRCNEIEMKKIAAWKNK